MIVRVISLIVSEVMENGKVSVARSNIPIAPNRMPAQQNVNFLCFGLNFTIELTSLSISINNVIFYYILLPSYAKVTALTKF